MSGRDLLPRPVLIIIAIVVTVGWLVTVVAAILSPDAGGGLLTVTGLLAMVVGAAFGITPRKSPPSQPQITETPEKSDES